MGRTGPPLAIRHSLYYSQDTSRALHEPQEDGQEHSPLAGPRGTPRAENILEIIKILQANERVKLRVEAHKAAA